MAYLDQVEEDARKLSTDGPHSSYAQALYAESMARQSRYLEAADSFKKAIAAQPQPPCLHAEFGFMYVKQQKCRMRVGVQARECGACGIAASRGRLKRAWHPGNSAADTHAVISWRPRSAQILRCGTIWRMRSGTQRNLSRRSESELLLLSACAYYSGDYALASSASEALGPSQPMGGLYWSIKANQALALQSLAHFEQMAPNSVPKSCPAWRYVPATAALRRCSHAI